jgi:hypothetical protein
MQSTVRLTDDPQAGETMIQHPLRPERFSTSMGSPHLQSQTDYVFRRLGKSDDCISLLKIAGLGLLYFLQHASSTADRDNTNR